MRLIAAAPLALALSWIVPQAASAQSAPLHVQDKAFTLYTLEEDLGQVQLGSLATEKASSPEVRQLAADVVDYHRSASERLTAEAERLGLTPPTALNPVAQRTLETLQGLQGAAFDRAFLTAQVITDYGAQFGALRETRHGFDPALRQEGARRAEEMQANRRTAERLAHELGPASGSGPHTEDRNYLLYAMHIDMAQRGFAEIAAENADDERVRAFAQELVDYHSRSYDRLAELASARGVEPLRELSTVSQGTQTAMQGLSSPVLDWTFLNAQAFTSYGAHYRYERKAIHGRDPELRDLAATEARTARQQHHRALDIINTWSWDAPAS